MAKISLINCESYDRNIVRKAIKQHFDYLGGIDKFITAGDKVLVKPNLICPKSPSQPAQTHPAVICETARILVEKKAKVTIADSPAWSNTLNCLKALGCDQELKDMGVLIRDMDNPKKIKLPLTGLKASISQTALEADKIINLPKLKAHQQMTATIAVKNMFGAVPGKRKALWHYRQGENPETFAAMLLDIFLYIKPTLNIVDAITAMEGQGPINGESRFIGLLMASEDAIACEIACSHIIGLKENSLPIVKTAKKFNIGCSNMNEIEIIGSSLEKNICSEFKQADLTSLKFSLPRICKSVVKQLLILTKGHRSG
ncbi:MAG: DUF362 domain-containing protein [Sedimentisphaeraceae bacterium JB056]